MKDKIPVSLPEGYVDFYKTIETWQNEWLFRLKKAGMPTKRDAFDIDILKDSHHPLVELIEMELNPELYQRAVMEFIQLVSRERKASSARLEEIAGVLEELNVVELAFAVIDDDKQYFETLSGNYGLEADLVIFVLDHALRPFLRYFALPYQDSLGSEDSPLWHSGICPICGFKANFSRIRAEDGRRFLFCEHCFTEWEFKYLGCIYCGNTDPRTIKYFVIEGDDANQVFVCEKCKGYIKTFDERKGGTENDLFIAGIETVYLDLLAKEKGYSDRLEIQRDLN